MKRNCIVFYLAPLILSLSILSCATQPIDTVNKQIAAFEVSYKHALKTIQLWISEGRLVGVAKTDMQERIKEIEIARAAMYIAKGSGDLKTTSGQLSAANAALGAVRNYIVSKEKVP